MRRPRFGALPSRNMRAETHTHTHTRNKPIHKPKQTLPSPTSLFFPPVSFVFFKAPGVFTPPPLLQAPQQRLPRRKAKLPLPPSSPLTMLAMNGGEEGERSREIEGQREKPLTLVELAVALLLSLSKQTSLSLSHLTVDRRRRKKKETTVFTGREREPD
jgi:hypothetical protein